MAYADQRMSGNKLTALIIVAILHVVVGYALVTGLAYEAFKKIKETTSAVNIKDEPPPPPPPPPPKQDKLPPPPPIVAPPPPIKLNIAPPPIQAVTTPPPPAPVFTTAAPPPPPPPPPPAAPKFTPKSAQPKGRPQDWATTDDYPSGALREQRQGTTGFSVSVGPDGRVTDCQITRSSGSPDLDSTTCNLIRRRARFAPAMDGEGQPTTGSYSSSVRWQIPKE